MSSLHESGANGFYLTFARNRELAQVNDFFLERGWNVCRGRNDILVPTMFQAVFGCGDERYIEGEVPDDHRYGPSFFGGTVGIATLRCEPTHKGIRRAAVDISNAGFRPGMHGDIDHQELGCGFNRLLTQGHFGELAGRPDIDLKQAKKALQEMGGSYVDLKGLHTADKLNFNLVPGTTTLSDGKAFGVDAWFPLILGIEQYRLLEFTAATVEALKPDAKNVTIYV